MKVQLQVNRENQTSIKGDRQEDRSADRRTDRDREIDRQRRQTDKQTDRQADRQRDRQKPLRNVKATIGYKLTEIIARHGC